MAPVLAEGPDGKVLYEKKCAMCHGKDGVPGKMAEGSGNFKDPEWQKANSLEAVIAVSSAGKEGTKMSAYKDKMTADEIKAVAEYVKSLK
jgi:cytochrome c6